MKARISRPATIAAVVAVLSVLAALNAYRFPLAFPDEAEYWTLATNIAQSGTFSYDGLTPSAYRPPVVAWILTPLAATGMPMAVARPFFIIFFAATGALTGLLLCRVFQTSTFLPLLGTAFVLSHPLYFFSAGNLYPQQVLTPLLLAGLALVCRKPASARAAILRSLGVGALTAASLLTSAPALFSLLPLFGVLAWEDWASVRAGKINAAYRLALAGLVVVVCIAPYVVRNARNVHSGLYLSLNSGINLLLGNSPGATPTSGVNVDLSSYAAGGVGESEFEANRRLTQAAVSNISTNPEFYVGLYFRKLFAGFANSVQTVTHGESKLATIALRGYMAVAWVGIGILCVSLMRRPNEVQDFPRIDRTALKTLTMLVLAAYLLSVAGYALFFMRLRFRIPVDVALAVVAAAGWGISWSSLRAKNFLKP